MEEMQTLGLRNQQLVTHTQDQQGTINWHQRRLQEVIEEARHMEQRALAQNQDQVAKNTTLVRNFANFEERASEQIILKEGEVALLAQRAEVQVAQQREKTESEIAIAQQHIQGWKQNHEVTQQNIEQVKAEMQALKDRNAELSAALADQDIMKALATSMMEADDVVTILQETKQSPSSSQPSQLQSTPTDAAKRRRDEMEFQQIIIDDSPMPAPAQALPAAGTIPISGAPGSHPTPNRQASPLPWPLPDPIQQGGLQPSQESIPVEQPHPATPRQYGPDDDTDLASITTTPVATPDRAANRGYGSMDISPTMQMSPVGPIRYRIATPVRSASAPRAGLSTPQRPDPPASMHRRSNTVGPRSRPQDSPKADDEAPGAPRSRSPHRDEGELDAVVQWEAPPL